MASLLRVTQEGEKYDGIKDMREFNYSFPKKKDNEAKEAQGNGNNKRNPCRVRKLTQNLQSEKNE